MALISALFLLIWSLTVSRIALAAENLSQLWKNWREVLIIVKPQTVIKRHRQGLQALLAMEVGFRLTIPGLSDQSTNV